MLLILVKHWTIKNMTDYIIDDVSVHKTIPSDAFDLWTQEREFEKYLSKHGYVKTFEKITVLD